MANLVLMPQLGISEESAVLTRWLVKEGDTVSLGTKLFELETGKAAFEVEAEYEGTVLKLLANEGDELPIQAPVCVIGQPGEAFELPQGAAETGKAAEQPSAPPKETVKQSTPEAPAASTAKDGFIGVSPRARALAASAGADPSKATPTGAEGRIIERDVRRMLEEGPQAQRQETAKAAPQTTLPAAPQDIQYRDEPLTRMRKVIAVNMMKSLAEAAQLTNTTSFDATNIMQYRKILKQNPETAGITLTDMILYAVTRTLPGFPTLNAWLTGETMRYFDDVNLACAVDTERGLMVPVIFGAGKKSLLDISLELKSLASACRGGAIDPSLLSGGSFTVSNLGSYGIESFTPILNAPQTGILGVNTIIERVRKTENGVTTYPCMPLSLTYDHRAIDGAPASAFLKALCGNLEHFTALLAKG